MRRAVSKSVPKPHHRPSRRARERILEAADQWARVDGWPASPSDTGCEVVEKFIGTAFEHGLPYTEARALLETLIDRAPRSIVRELVSDADAEIAAFEEYFHEEAKYAAISRAVGCSLTEAERIYKSHRARTAKVEVAS